jgi:hypothetical protein
MPFANRAIVLALLASVASPAISSAQRRRAPSKKAFKRAFPNQPPTQHQYVRARKPGKARVLVAETSTSGPPAGPRRFATIVPAIKGRLPKPSTEVPGFLFVLGDLSSSMAGGFAGQQGYSKADVVAEVIEGILGDLRAGLAKEGAVEDVLDVALEGYGTTTGPLFTGPLSGRRFVSIAALGTSADEASSPGWALRRPTGSSPTRFGFYRMRETLALWTRRPAVHHLVLGVHISDGDPGDGDPTDEVALLAREVARGGGELLMTNIHLSSGGADVAVVFPDEADAAGFDVHGQLLFELSSPVPSTLAKRLGTKPGARMMAYNATVAEFARVLGVGVGVDPAAG